MATTAPDKELMDIEQRFWDSMQNADARTASQLTNESCIAVGAQGIMAVTPDKMASLMKEATWDLKEYKFDTANMLVRRITDNVAVVAYGVKEDLTVEGRPVSFEAFDSSVWVRKGNAWTCVLHTETPAGDAFGRDKK